MKIRFRFILSLTLCSLIHGCGGGVTPRAEPDTPNRDENSTPRAGISVEAPSSPVESDPAEEPDAADAPAITPARASAGERLTPEVHARFARGISLEAANALTSVAPVRVGGDDKGTEIYRWADETGANFTARFDGGLLTTKSSLSLGRAPVSPEVAHAATREALDTLPVAQIAPGVYIPLDRAVRGATEQPLGVTEIPEAPEVDGAVSVPPAPSASEVPDGPRVAIAGAARRARDGDSDHSSYHPPAKLPGFSRSLEEGSFEIRFYNPFDVPVTAGLRQEKLGRDAVVPPKGRVSMKVNRGVYQLFFLRDDEVDTLFEAQPITIDGFKATDVEVRLDPEDVDVRLIDYSQPDS